MRYTLGCLHRLQVCASQWTLSLAAKCARSHRLEKDCTKPSSNSMPRHAGRYECARHSGQPLTPTQVCVPQSDAGQATSVRVPTLPLTGSYASRQARRPRKCARAHATLQRSRSRRTLPRESQEATPPLTLGGLPSRESPPVRRAEARLPLTLSKVLSKPLRHAPCRRASVPKATERNTKGKGDWRAVKRNPTPEGCAESHTADACQSENSRKRQGERPHRH